MHTMHTRERNFIFSFIYKGFRAFFRAFFVCIPGCIQMHTCIQKGSGALQYRKGGVPNVSKGK